MNSVPRSTVADADSSYEEGKVRVLLIDDHALVADALREIFDSKDDIEFFYCSDPTSALKVVSRIRPTVILLDLIMPKLDGLDLLKEFRATVDLADVPIVVLSSKEEPETKEQAFAAGADDYLVKLPDEIEIIARVRYHSRAYLASRKLQDTVDELENAYSQLFQSEKMASIGMLVAGVAHEINNPIAFVTSNLNMLGEYYQDVFKLIDACAKLEERASGESEDVNSLTALRKELKIDFIREDIRQVLDECKDGLARVRNIVDNLRDFSRNGDAEPKLTDLHAELDRTLSIANNEIKYKADVSKEYGDLPEVECIPPQINQVMLNLLVNAAQAIEGRGVITIRTHAGALPDELREQDADDDRDVDWSSWVCVQISDTGAGIEPDTLRHIFDPFFTTKEAGKGTGLGLSVSRGIIRGHGGHIVAESEPGQGTTFSVWLPVRRANA